MQDGSNDNDAMYAVAPGTDGSVVLVGHTCGTWVTTDAGLCDAAAVKLDANGTVVWTWQVQESALVSSESENFVTRSGTEHQGLASQGSCNAGKFERYVWLYVHEVPATCR